MRKPTLFTVLMPVFIIILLIVILTSNRFRNCASGQSRDNESTEKTDTTEKMTDAAAGPEVTEANTEELPLDDIVIYIDPGHGFGDSGASSDYLPGYHEREITLLVAQEVVSMLKAKGYNAFLTHDGKTMPKASNDDGNDLFSALDERPTYVNENGGNLLVSLHCDAFEDENVSGTRIHYCGDNNFADASADLADMLVRSVHEIYGQSRTARAYPHNGDDAYNITRFVKAPAALIEMGFVSNPDDAACMLDPAWRTKMAESVTNGIAGFLANYDPEAKK